jgi:20S proteasome subunit beta 6
MDGLPSYYAAPVVEHRWSPYADNHGSVVAIAGDDFAVIASDTRLSSGYSILSRTQTKLFPLTGRTVLGSTGCWADILTFTRLVEARMKIYRHTHDSEMSTAAFAQLVSTMLYGKRFFPYYVSNILVRLRVELYELASNE